MDNTIKKLSINHLTDKFVAIDTEQFIEIDGVQVKLNIPTHRVSYVNSISGRERLQAEQDVNFAAVIMQVWGDTPTVVDPEPPKKPELPNNAE